jgi:L-ascorbate metabolism protein UlaG (beta-lactamase superfamily)
MRLTKLGHSCVRLEKDGNALVIDPGIWSGAGALDGAAAVLITHEHADHLDVEAVRSALRRDRGLQLWTTAPVAGQVAEFGGQVHVVGDGDQFDAAGFGISVHGRDHALIYPDLPVVPNVGFAVDRTVFHPGDAFTVPGGRVAVLLVPVSAPWLKISEVIDYVRAVGPGQSIAIHDELLNPNGLQLVGNLMQTLARPQDGGFRRVEPGTGIDLELRPFPGRAAGSS